MPEVLNSPLTESQLYMLELMSKIDNNDLLELKKIVRKFLAEKLTKEVDEVWKKNNWSQKNEKVFLACHWRTPYIINARIPNSTNK
jgi:hypothetical protein